MMKKLLLLSFCFFTCFLSFSGTIDSIRVSPTSACTNSTIKIYRWYNTMNGAKIYLILSDVGGSNFSSAGSSNYVDSSITLNGSSKFDSVTYTIPGALTSGNYKIAANDSFVATTPDALSNLFAVSSTPSVSLTSAGGTNNQTVCISTAITNITYSVTGATGAGVTGLPSGVSGNFSAGTFTISGTPTASGTFNYTVTTSGGCTSATATGSITVTANPTITLTSAAGTNNQTICLANAITNITYSVTNATGASASGLPTGVSGSYSSGTFTISGTPIVPGTYNYTVSSSGGCTTATANGTIIVNSNATITRSSAPGTDAQTLCVNTAITNITYTTTGATGVSASGLPSGVTGNFNSGTYTISGTPTVSGTFNYTLTTIGLCSSATANGTITVTQGASISLTSAGGTNSQTVCINTAIIDITYSVGNGGTGAGVTGLPTGVSGSFNAGTFAITGTPTTSGTFNYTVTTTGGCGAGTANGTITVRAAATANAGSAQSICQGNKATLSGSVGGSATGGTWSAPSGSFNNSNSLTADYTPSITSGNVTLTLTTTGPCAPAISTVVITVNPTATVNAGPATSPMCQGGTSVALGGSVGGSATGGIWDDGGVGGTFNPNNTTLNATWTPPATYNGTATLRLTATGGNCGSPNDSKNQKVNPNASLNLLTGNSTQTFCEGNSISTIIYAIKGGGPSTTVTGLPGGLSTNLSSNNDTFTISGTPNTSGIFNYTVTTVGNCGPSNANGTITINPKPTKPVFLSSNPATVCFKQKGVNLGVAAGGSGGITYFWSCTNTSVVFHGANHPNCLVDFPATGSFDIYVTAINTAGCRDSSKVTYSPSQTVPTAPGIMLGSDGKTLICLDNQQSSYQWGYDDTAFVAHDIAGATLQDYTSSTGFDPKKNYYVKLNSGNCSYKVVGSSRVDLQACKLEYSIVSPK